jgi:hypothetical protein
MDEQAARDVLLIKAIETTDRERRILSDDDRMYASRSARELVQWDASESRQAATPELFLHKRARQLLGRLAERMPTAASLLQARSWMRALGIGLPVIALLIGVLADRIGDPHRVDLLSLPLLLMVLWNLAVYIALLLSPFFPRRDKSQWLDKLKRPSLRRTRKPPALLAAALTRFSEEWLRLSAPLAAARAARILHLCAALLALGAVMSLYLRGIFSEYRVGWESTFLDAGQVHALLSWLFMPAISLLGLPGFSTEQVQALHFPQSASGSGAQWVHLYAATLFLLIFLPRLVLAAVAWRRERKLSARLGIDLTEPYFQRLCAGFTPGGTALQVCPYSFRIDEARQAGLASVARSLLGDQTSLILLPAVAYGEDPGTAPSGAATTAVLFSLSATPEVENHGRILDHFRQQAASSIVALIDESAYLERLGKQGAHRAAERAALWREFCAQHRTPAAIVNLLAPQSRLEELETLLQAARGTA